MRFPVLENEITETKKTGATNMSLLKFKQEDVGITSHWGHHIKSLVFKTERWGIGKLYEYAESEEILWNFPLMEMEVYERSPSS